MRTQLRLLGNVATEIAAVGASIVAGIFLSRYLVHKLTVSGYGLWTLINSVVVYLGYMDLGLRPAVSRLIAGQRGSGDVEGINRTLSTALGLLLVSGAVAALGACALAPWFPSIFRTDSPSAAMDAEVTRAVLWTGFTIAISLPLDLFEALLLSFEKLYLCNLVNALATVGRVIGCVLVVERDLGIVGLAYVTFWTTLLPGLAKGVLSWVVFRPLRLSWGRYDRALAQQVYRFGFWLFIQIAAVQISAFSGNVIAGYFLGTTAVAIYAIAMRLLQFARIGGHALTKAIYPIAAGMEARGERSDQAHLFVLGSQASLGYALLMVTIFIGYGGRLIEAWVGHGFAQSALILIIGAVPFVGAVAQQMVGAVLQEVDVHRRLAQVYLVEAIAAAGLGIALARGFGLVGIALAAAVAVSISTYVVQPVLFCRRLGLPLGEYYREVYGRVMVWMAPLSGLIGALRWIWLPARLLPLLALLSGCAVVYFAALYWVFFHRDGRRPGGVVALAPRQG